ncbi:hypothetical protein Hamer_G030976, partial [Homarus americanus]
FTYDKLNLQKKSPATAAAKRRIRRRILKNDSLEQSGSLPTLRRVGSHSTKSNRFSRNDLRCFVFYGCYFMITKSANGYFSLRRSRPRCRGEIGRTDSATGVDVAEIKERHLQRTVPAKKERRAERGLLLRPTFRRRGADLVRGHLQSFEGIVRNAVRQTSRRNSSGVSAGAGRATTPRRGRRRHSRHPKGPRDSEATRPRVERGTLTGRSCPTGVGNIISVWTGDSTDPGRGRRSKRGSRGCGRERRHESETDRTVGTSERFGRRHSGTEDEDASPRRRRSTREEDTPEHGKNTTFANAGRYSST